MLHEDRRLIEDYLPIEAIIAEASREKSVRKGHISTLHNPAKQLDYAKKEIVAARLFDIPALAIEQATRALTGRAQDLTNH